MGFFSFMLGQVQDGSSWTLAKLFFKDFILVYVGWSGSSVALDFNIIPGNSAPWRANGLCLVNYSLSALSSISWEQYIFEGIVVVHLDSGLLPRTAPQDGRLHDEDIEMGDR